MQVYPFVISIFYKKIDITLLWTVKRLLFSPPEWQENKAVQRNRVRLCP